MKSMTGFGSAEGRVGGGIVYVEIKTVNHRHCDVLLKIPPKMNPLDPLIRDMVRSRIRRGKVELFIKERRQVEETCGMTANVALAKKYQRCLNDLKKAIGPSDRDISLLDVIDPRELITVSDVDVDYSRHWGAIKGIASGALKKLDAMREKEGRFLLNDQLKRLSLLDESIGKITEEAGRNLKHYHREAEERLVQRSGSNSAQKEKLDAEFASLMEKMDIAEELVRLKSHLKQYHHIARKPGEVGRELDFLLQEMNREANTIGSKAANALIARYVVSIKSELEKLREQVQNIE